MGSQNSARLSGVPLEDIQIDPFMRVLRKLSSLPTCEEREAEEDEEDDAE